MLIVDVQLVYLVNVVKHVCDKRNFQKIKNEFFFLLAYFSCPAPGLYADPINCKFGRYFQCTGLSLTSASCSRGLRYNFMKMQCDSDVSCPP